MCALSISVVIPVFDDETRLSACLDAVSRQTYPPDLIQVIVVDNGSPRPLDEVAHQFPDVHFLSEPAPGSYAARNAGLTRATGDVIAFTDSDCLPDPEWLSRVATTMSATPEVGLLAGRVDVFPRTAAGASVAELYDIARGFPQRAYVEIGFGVTANLSVRRGVVDTVGSFRADLRSGGDREWCLRAVSHGHRIRYADDVIVRHPARETWAQHWTKAVRTTEAMPDLTSRALGVSGRALLRGYLRPPVRAVGVARRVVAAGRSDHLARLVLAQWLGYLMLCAARTLIWFRTRAPDRRRGHDGGPSQPA